MSRLRLQSQLRSDGQKTRDSDTKITICFIDIATVIVSEIIETLRGIELRNNYYSEVIDNNWRHLCKYVDKHFMAMEEQGKHFMQIRLES